MNVVIIDDEEPIRKLLKRLIPWDKLGFELAGEAADGIEGLDMCLRLKPDIILTDIRMPGLSGLELMEKLAESLPKAKVIIISGYEDFSYAQRAIKSSVFDYILKPVEDDFVKTLEKARDEILMQKKEKMQANKIKLELKKLQDEVSDTTTDSDGYQNDNTLIQKVLNYIQENYNGNITLETTAQKFFLNPTYFSELFKHETGKGYNEFVTYVRMERAKNLLGKLGLKVNEISGMVGYQDSNYFVRAFKKYEGLTPCEYRNKKMTRKK
jgi:two-component system response regulator YesN